MLAHYQVNSNLSCPTLSHCLEDIPGIFSLYIWKELQGSQVWSLSAE